MFGSTILEVMIGLVFIYIVLGVFNTAVIEFIVRILKLRSNTLADGIRNLLSDETLREQLYKHPLIKSLSRSGKPSYIPSRNFALALIDTVEKVTGENKVLFESVLGQITDPGLKKTIENLAGAAQEDYEKLRDSLETRFDNAMDRVSGWYARKTQLTGLIVAFIVAILLNADTLMIFQAISNDETLRDSLVAAAENTNANQAALESEIKGIEFPLGWSFEAKTVDNRNGFPIEPDDIVNKVLGIIVSGIAISLGAQFWFQMLNRLVAVRQGIRATGPASQPSSGGGST